MSHFLPIFVLILTISSVYGQMLAGGHTPQDPNDPEFMTRSWKAAKSLNEDASNAGPYLMIPVKVEKAESQVVSGINYFLEVIFGESTCKKGTISPSSVNSANCQLRANGNRALYKISIYERPWQNYEQYSVSKIRDIPAN